MRGMRLFVMLVVVLAVCPAFAPAQDKTAVQPPDFGGNWTGEIKSPVSYSPIPICLRLTQEGETVTGTGGPSEATQSPIADVKRTGKMLHFSISAEGLKYTLDLEPGKSGLQGTALGEDQQGHSWTGKVSLGREKPRSPEKK